MRALSAGSATVGSTTRLRTGFRSSRAPGGSEARSRLEKMLRQDLRLAENGHEARVAAPAGHDVEVDVLVDACSRRAPEVPAEVESLRRVSRPQRLDAAEPESVDLERGLVGDAAQLALVRIGRDEQVPRGVRELVQEHERGLAALDDEALGDVTSGLRTKRAAELLVGLADVLEAPGRPQRSRHRPILPTSRARRRST